MKKLERKRCNMMLINKFQKFSGEFDKCENPEVMKYYSLINVEKYRTLN